jgi:hypothetical protein
MIKKSNSSSWKECLRHNPQSMLAYNILDFLWGKTVPCRLQIVVDRLVYKKKSACENPDGGKPSSYGINCPNCSSATNLWQKANFGSMTEPGMWRCRGNICSPYLQVIGLWLPSCSPSLLVTLH